MTKLKELIQN